MTKKVKILPDHYLSKIGKDHLKNYIEEETYHELTGGTFMAPVPAFIFGFPPKVTTILMEFTDVCSCPVVDKCQKVLILRVFNN
jgi:hypothetical protein